MGQVNCCRGPRDDPDPVQQCTPVPASPQPLLRQRVRLSQGRATRKRDLLLFGDALVIAKPKRGSAPRPQLCLALGQLQVLSSRKGAAGDAAQEEEEGRHTNSLVLVWPCGFCTVTFPPPEGVEGARVTQLPSIKLLLQELSGRNAATTLHASSLQRLVQGQAQDLLALLAEHGPSTEGIFRLAVKEHVSRELREALDSGAEVHLESQPAHVLAVLLKDFLRKIPSKLLGAELYEEWMSALQKTSRQEKLAALREVAGKLPQANLLLLKSLLSLLQRISRNAASSRMTAGNLAICVGPNLLSPPEEQTLPLDALVQVTGQVTGLVEFLIEHHGDLFGEEVAGLAGTSAEESPAPGLEAETAEVPPVAVESQHLKSSSGERSLPGPSQESRKRKLTCEEGSDGHPGRKRRRLERELSGMGD
ncbi:T-cell activation Rho GTPase-activating protein-like [Grus japonensis]|uniref:T-cell activation Rho GTPase-activating protein-like n=1 Tax=Grus japonensis TaxID=30415 RepID=A0ABC9YDP0_GRUJA